MAFEYYKYGIVISIDFGTTFSGTCYSFTSELFKGELRDTRYPDVTMLNKPEQSYQNKTPSLIIYDRNFHLLHWGRAAQRHIENGELKPDQIVKERFRLGLPTSVPKKDDIYKTNNAKKRELENMRATIDYFREIFNHTVSTIQKNIDGVRQISVEKENIRFVITVPTLWNEIQRSLMRTVAKEAGLITDEDHANRFLIINESSAAALYCESQKTDFQDLTPGDKYIICDAGGGTVNFAVYETVESLTSDPADTFRRCQLTTDIDDGCGSTFIDKKMRNLLTLFCYDGVPAKDEEEKERDKLFSPVMDKFINEIKPYFGKRSRDFKFPKCDHAKLLEAQTCSVVEGTIEEYIDYGDHNDGQCIVCKAEDFKHMYKPNFGEDTVVVLRDAIIVPKLKLYLPDGVKYERTVGICKLTIPYDIMRTEVFEEVTKRTLTLINRQIKKANNNIRRTYLIGGFGNSPYLRKRIRKAFFINGTSFPNSRYRVGDLITDDRGDSAAMRGAMVLAIDVCRRRSQSDFVERKFEHASADKYNTLICLDIGYLSTSCSYRDLGKESNEMTEIIDWPGRKNNFMIPTAKETVNGETTWGAKVKQPIDPDKKNRITLSKLMSGAKADLRRYFCEYLRLVLDHVHRTIDKTNSNTNKYRYVITMENCYQFFDNKSEMRYIAQLAGIISKEDPVERLLLIGRDAAAAMYFEKEHFSSTTTNINRILLINMYDDICSLSLTEHTKISGSNIKQDTEIFRNVRSVRSATFDFDFASRITLYLNKYVSENACIECRGNHQVYTSTYYTELKRGFLDYIKTRLNFCDYSRVLRIPITDSGCCITSIKVYDLLEYIFLPAVKDLAFEINRFASQTDMIKYFGFDKIILSGTLLETDASNYELLEGIVINYISKTMNIDVGYINPSKHNGREALLGAAIYGNCPEKFTERVACISYAVNVRAYKLEEFENIAKKKIEKMKEIYRGEVDLKNRVYSLESHYSYPSDKRVELFYRPHVETGTFKCEDDDLSYVIRRGDKVLEKHQSEGISKTFYARENCIVHATVYSSNVDGLPREGIKTDNPHFRKIRQFEIYVTRDEDDPMTAYHLDLRFIPGNKEVVFEATAGPRLGMVSDCRFGDGFLVANIYDDRQFTEVGNLSLE
ncbi:hypothetical protein MFLAVUS_003578 [Mucor flavus]|uniref:Uncharacterized protein n=1 Tax=Mucor flavus TaxID=439312 RepID=A0ABP9YTG7_9FUNG